jgi:hypothetical protein
MPASQRIGRPGRPRPASGRLRRVPRRARP